MALEWPPYLSRFFLFVGCKGRSDLALCVKTSYTSLLKKGKERHGVQRERLITTNQTIGLYVGHFMNSIRGGSSLGLSPQTCPNIRRRARECLYLLCGTELSPAYTRLPCDLGVLMSTYSHLPFSPVTLTKEHLPQRMTLKTTKWHSKLLTDHRAKALGAGWACGCGPECACPGFEKEGSPQS